ncbi:MAG: pyrroline-5-carboxylate reductase [Myxococcales bacterium]|nr:pyrroline-5-carboxylate reductase [Myxococcales bacterium]
MKLAIAGCGKMTGAMLHRWLKAGVVRPEDVRAITRSQSSADRVRAEFGVVATTEGAEAIAWADVVLLGIKPQQVHTVLPTWRPHAHPGQVWMSVLAGTRVARIQQLLGDEVAVVRLMPNTPVRVGNGATAVVWPDTLSPARQDDLHELLAALGEVVALQEDRIDAFTAIAGSGPAYVFLFLESLAQAAKALGFEDEQAERLALGVVRGASELATIDGRDASTLRAEVTSPGGMTHAAISVFQAAGWPEITTDAVEAALAHAAVLADA